MRGDLAAEMSLKLSGSLLAVALSQDLLVYPVSDCVGVAQGAGGALSV